MKKLLAILLTLMLPLCGLAEENAPQATLTTITFRDFNGRALMAEMEEAAETAYRDLLDALRVEVYRQGFTSCELFLNDQWITACRLAARMSTSAVMCWAARCT